MTVTYPSHIHPELTKDRIQLVVELINRARREALEHFEPEKGELSRSLGLRILERLSCLLLSHANEQASWLKVLEPGLQLRCSIGGVPFGLYRGSPNSPPGRTLKSHRAEVAAAEQTAFFYAQQDSDPSSYRWRFAVVTDDNLATVSISIVLIDGHGTVRGVWDVVPTGLVPLLTPVVADTAPSVAKGADLGPPVIGGIKNPDADANAPPDTGTERLADIIQFPSGGKKA